jgi:hypothetical protein
VVVMKIGAMSLDDLIASYHRAVHDHDLDAELSALAALTGGHPELAWPWFDLGTRHKWLRQWPECVNANLEALARIPDPRGAAEAWNLGIAATALGEWVLARQAWGAFGVDIPAGVGPIQGEFGLAAIQLNPAPRFHEPELVLDGVRYADEVVLARRCCPASAQIVGVPVPESGHRFGDVILYDGDPVAQVSHDEQTLPVFNEIMLLEPSGYPTLGVIVSNAGRAAFQELADLFAGAGFAADLWTSTTTAATSSLDSADLVTVGMGASPEQATRLLAQWALEGNDRDFGDIEILL